MPENVRRLHGEPNKRRHRVEPQPAERKPEPTDTLGLEARAVWDRLTAELDAMGILYAADGDPLAMLCSSVAVFREAERKLADEGLILEDRDGAPRRNPWWLIRRDALNEIMRLGSAFGLTPVARTHLATPGKPDDEPDARQLLSA